MTRQHAALLGSGLATFLLMGAGQAVYGLALPVYAAEFQMTLGSVGWLISAHWIGCALAVLAMFLGILDMTPQKALGVMAVGAACIAFAIGWWGTLAGAVVFGLGYGFATVVLNPRVLKAFGARGTAMLSLLNAVFALGAIAAPLVFVALGSAPNYAFLSIMVLCALVWLIATATGPMEPATAPRPAATSFRPHWPILMFGAAAIGLEATLIGLGPSALIVAGETDVRAAELLSGFFVAFLAARGTLVFTSHLVGSFTLFTAAMATLAACAIGAILVSPGVFFMLMGISASLFFQSYYVTATRKMGDNPRVPALIIGAGLVGGIASPVIVANLLQGAGDRGFFWIIGGATVVLSLAALASLRTMNRQARPL